MDETYVRVKGKWRYLYRAVDSTGATLDFLLSAKQAAAAAKRHMIREGQACWSPAGAKVGLLHRFILDMFGMEV